MAPAPATTSDHAIIIGAGIAGLAAAIRLSVLGFRVTVLERHDHAGGKIRTTPSAAGPVDAGPTVLTMRHVFDDLFSAADARLDDMVTLVPQPILARHFWPDGSALDLFADAGDSREAIRGFAGSRAAQEFDAFHRRAAELYAAFDVPMMQAERPTLAALARHVLRRPKLISRMAPVSSLAGLLRRNFGDPRLRQLFGRYATYVGGAPHLSPAVLALIWHAEASGVWVVKGGMHKLAEAMAEIATRLGAEIRTQAHVARIEMQAGCVAAVALCDSERIAADIVLFAGDPRALAIGALGAAVRHVAPQTRTLPRSFSARVHSFAAEVSGPDLHHHNVFFADDGLSEFHDLAAGRIPNDPTLYICAEDRGLGTRSAGPERFEIIANAPATATPDQPEDPDTWHQRTMTRLANFGVTFDPRPTPSNVTSARRRRPPPRRAISNGCSRPRWGPFTVKARMG